MKRRPTRFLLLAITLWLSPSTGLASEAAWAALAEPGTVAIMRHALAPGTGDPAHFQVDDCATQRNLDERGRAQARAAGVQIRARGISFDRVLSSQWCRCLDTAREMGIGTVEPYPVLNSFFANRADGPAQTRALRAFLRDLPRGEKVMLVAHQVNITALTGQGVSSGEIFVLEVRGDDIVVRGRIDTL